MTTASHISGKAGAATLDRALSGLLPAGSSWEPSPAERSDYLVFSTEQGPRLILPRDASLGLAYSRVWARNGSLWKWTALRTAYRLGTLHRVPGVKPIKLHLPADADWTHLGWPPARAAGNTARASEASDPLATPVLTVFMREPGPSQKAIAFVGESRGGGPLLVAKAPLGEDSGRRIRVEAALLRHLGHDGRARPHIPALRGFDERREVSAQAYVDGGKTGLELTATHVGLLRLLAEAGVGADAHRGDAEVALEALLDDLGASSATAAAGIPALTSAVPAEAADLSGVPSVVEHGDFYPWNLFERAGALVALDWEFGRLGGLPLWDAVHFRLRVSVGIRRRGRDAAIDDLIEFCAGEEWSRMCRVLGVDHPPTARYLTAVSVLRFFKDDPPHDTTHECLARWVATGTWRSALAGRRSRR